MLSCPPQHYARAANVYAEGVEHQSNDGHNASFGVKLPMRTLKALNPKAQGSVVATEPWVNEIKGDAYAEGVTHSSTGQV